MSEDFATYIDSARARLESSKAGLLQDQRIIEEQLANIDREFAAIDAYEAAKAGKAQAPAKPAGRSCARRGSRQETIVQALAASPLGMTRGELLEVLGVKGDTSGEMSVSNALSALLRRGLVNQREGGGWIISSI